MNKTAFILLDVQRGILERVPHETTDYLSLASRTLKASRAAGVHIIHIRTCFRPGHPEVSSRNFSFGKIASFGGFVEGDPATNFAPEVEPVEKDVVVTKRRVSGFSGSDLDTVLRGLDVDYIVIAGIATSGAVLSTVRQAADLDYKLTVLGDLCLDTDDETHRVLVEKIFPRQANVLSAEQWIHEIGSQEA